MILWIWRSPKTLPKDRDVWALFKNGDIVSGRYTNIGKHDFFAGGDCAPQYDTIDIIGWHELGYIEESTNE